MDTFIKITLAPIWVCVGYLIGNHLPDYVAVSYLVITTPLLALIYLFNFRLAPPPETL